MKIRSKLLLLSVILMFMGCHKDKGKISSPTKEVKVLKFAMNRPQGSLYYKAILAFKDYIEKESNGALKIELYPGGDFFHGDVLVLNQMLKNGDIAFSDTFGDSVFDKNSAVKEYIYLAYLPYLISSQEDLDTLWNTKLTKDVQEEIKSKLDVKGLFAPLLEGRRHVISKKPLEKLEDFKGLKLRVPPDDEALVNFVKQMKAIPVAVPYSEAYNAMKNNLVDALENEFSGIDSMKFYEVGKNLVLTSHSISTVEIMIGNSGFNSLTKEQQDIVMKSVDVFREHMLKLVKESRESYLKKFRDNGVRIIEIDKEPFREAMKPLYNEVNKRLADSGYGENFTEELIKKFKKN